MEKCFCFRWQVCTQRSWKRPYGVGLLVAGLDESGAHLYYNCPSGNYFEYQAFAIGSRSQAAKTYLERRFESFTDASRDDLVKDALMAIRETLQGETLKSSVCTVAVVGVGEPFHILDQATVQQMIDAFEIVADQKGPDAEPDAEPDAGAGQEASDEPKPEQGAAAGEGVAPMDIWGWKNPLLGLLDEFFSTMCLEIRVSHYIDIIVLDICLLAWAETWNYIYIYTQDSGHWCCWLI